MNFLGGSGVETHLVAFALGIGAAMILGLHADKIGGHSTKGKSEEEEPEGDNSYVKEGHKMILAVRSDLKMGKGKVAAQCSHATLGAYKRALQRTPGAVKYWERIGQKKITVKLQNEEQMDEIEASAKQAGLVTYVVVDAGHTQVAAGSKTVLAIGPAPESLVNTVTSQLKLIS
jgi:peptidyl-tRNA hydrolase